jgi:alpha,alpha-trehalase
MDWALLYHALGARFSRQARGMLKSTAELVRRSWQEPDHGIWELRGEPAHYTLGKIMAWVALDRARQLFGRSAGLDEACRQIEQVVSERGIDSRGALREVLDRDGTDASLLLAATVGFPLPRGVFERTVGDIRRQLGSGDHLYRAQSLRAGGEGAFLACSFWLVSALLHLDRAAEARSLFDRLLGCANDVGLYAEEIVPETGAFLGNFPQALTHLALIEAATNLELHRSRGAEALRGSHADRARLGVEATAGLRGLWAAFKKSGRVGRVRSSRRSILA